MHQFLFYNESIIHLYVLRAQMCSSSGGQNCITQRLATSHSAGGRPMHRLGERGLQYYPSLQSVMMQDAV